MVCTKMEPWIWDENTPKWFKTFFKVVVILVVAAIIVVPTFLYAYKNKGSFSVFSGEKKSKETEASQDEEIEMANFASEQSESETPKKYEQKQSGSEPQKQTKPKKKRLIETSAGRSDFKKQRLNQNSAGESPPLLASTIPLYSKKSI